MYLQSVLKVERMRGCRSGSSSFENENSEPCGLFVPLLYVSLKGGPQYGHQNVLILLLCDPPKWYPQFWETPYVVFLKTCHPNWQSDDNSFLHFYAPHRGSGGCRGLSYIGIMDKRIHKVSTR